MRKVESFLDDILGLSKIEAYWRSRLSSKSVGERAQSLHEIERTFMITCCEITGDWLLSRQTGTGTCYRDTSEGT
jgi:hypothetical protein